MTKAVALIDWQQIEPAIWSLNKKNVTQRRTVGVGEQYVYKIYREHMSLVIRKHDARQLQKYTPQQ